MALPFVFVWIDSQHVCFFNIYIYIYIEGLSAIPRSQQIARSISPVDGPSVERARSRDVRVLPDRGIAGPAAERPGGAEAEADGSTCRDP